MTTENQDVSRDEVEDVCRIANLDETTSDLDSNLKREVQRNIEVMDRDYGIIAIAHRLSTVENADEIYTLEQGRIIESGTHEDLVKNGGKYAELYEIQAQ